MTAEEIEDVVLTYARSTLIDEGAGELIRASCRRFLEDLKRTDVWMSWKRVERVMRLVGNLRHFTGTHSGKVFALEPWQLWIVSNIVGFVYVDSGRRRFSSSYIEVARKNGKTFLAAALCLYFLIADGEDGAEVDLAANSKDQAAIALEYCQVLAEQLDPSKRILRQYKYGLVYPRKNAKLKCFAADSSKLDGFNASFALIDEYHAAPNSKVRDVIKSSMGMRKNPHICTITTAGFDKTLPCYKLREAAAAVVRGQSSDDGIFAAIYSPDDGDDWRSPLTWRKGNPNLGVTVTEEFIRGQVTNAQNDPTEEVSVRCKNLNQWTETNEVWIPEADVSKCMGEVYIAPGAPVWVGVDLAATGDLTAAAYLTIDAAGRYCYIVDYYTPQSTLERGKLAEKYKTWRNLGHLNVTPGNVTDYDIITNDIKKRSEVGQIRSISYDSWNATQWAITATAEGLPLVPYSQTIGSFNRPTKEFERAVLGGMALLQRNEVTKFCLQNVVIKTDTSGNSKPGKAAYINKIDGVIAMLMALGGYLQSGQVATPSIMVI